MPTAGVALGGNKKYQVERQTSFKKNPGNVAAESQQIHSFLNL